MSSAPGIYGPVQEDNPAVGYCNELLRLAAGGWRDIATAPRDGTLILVARGNRISVAAWCSETRGPGASGHVQLPGWIGHCCGEEIENEGWDTGYGFALELTGNAAPTHWQPLPAPPTAPPASDTTEGER